MDPAMAVFSSEQAIQAGQVRAPSLSCLTGESVLWQLEHALKHQREARIHVEYHIEQLQAELQRLQVWTRVMAPDCSSAWRPPGRRCA